MEAVAQAVEREAPAPASVGWVVLVGVMTWPVVAAVVYAVEKVVRGGLYQPPYPLWNERAAMGVRLLLHDRP